MFPIFSQKVLSIITLYFGIGVVWTIIFPLSLWFRRLIVKLLGLNFGLGVVSMIETWCSCCIGVVSTSFYPISSSLAVYDQIWLLIG